MDAERAAGAHRVLAPGIDPEAAFVALFGAARRSFWLDTGGGGRCVLGSADGPSAALASYSAGAGEVRVTRSDGLVTIHPGTVFDYLAAEVLRGPGAGPAHPADELLHGVVGYLGYELKADCGARVTHPSPRPDAVLLHPDRVLVLDPDAGTAALAARGPDAEQWLDAAAAQLTGLRPPPGPAPLGSDDVDVLDLAERLQVRFRHRPARYRELVEACQRRIERGETYEMCLTNELTVPGRFDPLTTFRLLRRASPAPFAALLRLPDVAVVGSSPERFLSVDAAGDVESSPIKGTRPRGATPTLDAALAAELRAADKDRAEHVMIVDLVRHDLARTSVVGSVRVTSLFEVQSFATVHQLVSTVRARRRPELSTVDVLRAAFPGGSMTGAPKLRTMELLDELEAGPRGVYSGALGYLTPDGSADLSMVIRTLVIDGAGASLGVGGAVTSLSDPDAEVAEMLLKARAPLRVLAGTQTSMSLPMVTVRSVGNPK